MRYGEEENDLDKRIAIKACKILLRHFNWREQEIDSVVYELSKIDRLSEYEKEKMCMQMFLKDWDRVENERIENNSKF